jgi:hypothetical protein
MREEQDLEAGTAQNPLVLDDIFETLKDDIKGWKSILIHTGDREKGVLDTTVEISQSIPETTQVPVGPSVFLSLNPTQARVMVVSRDGLLAILKADDGSVVSMTLLHKYYSCVLGATLEVDNNDMRRDPDATSDSEMIVLVSNSLQLLRVKIISSLSNE